MNVSLDAFWNTEMYPPEKLKSNAPLIWSSGRGVDVWEMFCACASGDINSVRHLLESDPALVRSQYAYRTPLYFAVRENQIAVVQLLLNCGADPNLAEEGIAPHGHALYAAAANGHH